MKQKLLLFLIMLFPNVMFGQKKYKHEYRQYLISQESSLYINISQPFNALYFIQNTLKGNNY